MGGGCICKNYINKYLFKSNENMMVYENGQKKITKNEYNKISMKTSNVLYNVIENHKEVKKINKKYSDFQNCDKRHLEKSSNLKNLENKISNKKGPDTSFNETYYFNQKNGANEETNKNILSNNNSINFNGSKIFRVNSKKIENGIKEEEEEKRNSYTNRKNNINIQNNRKHQSFINKIKENEEGLRKAGTNFNYNYGENNFIFINISRGSSFLNRNDLEKNGSTTPKMSIGKENFEDITKGNKKYFSNFCKNIINGKRNQSICNNHLITTAFFHGIDMNKYCEETLNTINLLRINPESFLIQIDFLINNNIRQTEEGVFFQSNEIDEKIKLMENYKDLFENTKNALKKMINSSKNLKSIQYKNDLEIIFDDSEIITFDYNEVENEQERENEENDIKNIPSKLNLIYDSNDNFDLIVDEMEENGINENKQNENIIDFDEESKKEENYIIKDNEKKINIPIIKINNYEYNNFQFQTKHKPKLKKKKHNINLNLDLSDDKIANLILYKRKEIKNKYPLNIFKISVIKDIKISIFIQIAMEEFQKEKNGKTLKDIIFDPNYKYFAISWTNEINRNFISISCFA